MSWYLRLVAWIADAIKKKAESEDDHTIEARITVIEEKLTKIAKSTIPVALFASGLPVYLIGFAGSLKNAIELTDFEWNNLMYLVVGSLLVTYSMVKLSEKKRNIVITIILTYGTLIAVSIVNIFRFT